MDERVLMVGLTGGIGAGKSAVTARLAERGAVVADADRLAREVVAPGTDGLREVVAAFGPGVLDADGALDRPALAATVFGDETARRRLEAIIHPRVRAATARLVGAAAPDAIVVNDVPLLVEAGLAATYHLVVVVQAPLPVRLRRLVEHRGMTAAQADARIRAQTRDGQRSAAADVLIDNAGTLAELHAAVDELWDDRLTGYERQLRAGVPVLPAGPVRLADHDPRWPEQAARVAARIRHVLGAVRVDHVGSTAVPQLPAQDVLDLQLGVDSMEHADELAQQLAAVGLPRRAGSWWDNARDGSGARWEKRLHGSADPGRSVDLHVRVVGSPGWRFALLMRDHLRADPDRRAGCARFMARLAADTADPTSYALAKEPWFDGEWRAAEAWAAATGWQPDPT